MLNTADTQARKPQKFAVTALTMAITMSMLLPLSARADDLEIYQPSQTGGRKTLILMLDTSGTMNGGGKLRDLKNGMNTFLTVADPDAAAQAELEKTYVGLGHFNAQAEGDGSVASITVPTALLGPIGSAQRLAMKAKLDSLAAGTANTPSVNGYVEAAAYLLGTNTARATIPVTVAGKTTYTLTDNSGTASRESGFNASVDSTKVLGTTGRYKSPLPASADRQSCDGQGIYFLSGGQSNSSGTNAMSNIMANALGNTTYSSSATPTAKSTFCPDYSTLPGFYASQDSTSWNCMAQFAKTLYSRNNPENVKIQTAFVGFGSDFDGIPDGTTSTGVTTASNDALNACHLGSRLKAITEDDTNPLSRQRCAVDSLTNTNPPGGYGNGGFYKLMNETDVTLSVKDFIKHLGTKVVVPLVTGAPTIPVDDLNPNGFQPYGYMRMLQPAPAEPKDLLWKGNVKKYNLARGAMVSKGSTTTFILDANGNLVNGTTDEWNSSTGDGGIIDQGGAYSRVPMPVPTSADNIRPLFTDVGGVTSGVMTSVGSGAPLTAVKPMTSATPPALSTPLITTIPTFFGSSGSTALKNLSLLQKKRLINYLGFDLALDNTTAIPSPLTTPATPFLSMGGSIHAQPIQLSYSANISSAGVVSTTGREESVLYGSMEGALHLVNATTGVEQMAFVPKEILATTIQANALRKGQQDLTVADTPSQGVDGPWVADAAYKTTKPASATASAKITATYMNVYGGLRMGGSSYYGLDLFTKSGDTVTPRLLFQIDPNTAGFGRLGQSWSKPVIANVRYGNAITRVMIVGGGYDVGYENPSFIPPSTGARGNAVYMVNANTGELIWQAVGTSQTLPSGATQTVNANMIHSIPSRVSPIDRDGDGLIDSIYFADLGGQVFRADVNNKSYLSLTVAQARAKFPVRVERLADLATTEQKTIGTNPRFFEAPTVTIHDHQTTNTTFGLITAVSGNRSAPLDVLTVAEGGRNLTLPVNKAYGIIDRDIARLDLVNLSATNVALNANGSTYTARTSSTTLAQLLQNPQVSYATTQVDLETVGNAFFPVNTTSKDGWYRSLSSNSAGTELAVGTFRKPGGMKAFEEQVALTGKLYVPVYDPQGDGVPPADPCNARVVGETDLQTFCLPYGVCFDSTTKLSQTSTADTSGARFKLNADGTKTINDKVIGPGIRGISLGDDGTGTTGNNSCRGFTIVGNQSGTGSWNCSRKLVQTLWYEKQPNRSKVQ